ncbi:hypothetical protein D3C81_918620 [compost metagenome]
MPDRFLSVVALDIRQYDRWLLDLKRSGEGRKFRKMIGCAADGAVFVVNEQIVQRNPFPRLLVQPN